MAHLTIGAFAKAAGINVETIRFYQRKGLLPEPDKPYGSIRRYGEEDVARVRFVKPSALDSVSTRLASSWSWRTGPTARRRGYLRSTSSKPCAGSFRICIESSPRLHGWLRTASHTEAPSPVR